MNAAMLAKLCLAAGDRVKVGAGDTVILAAHLETGLPDGVVRVAAAHAATLALGPMSGVLSVEKA